MSESIQWSALTPDQQDRIIAEKIMGVPAICSGALHQDSRNSGFWTCDTCAAFGHTAPPASHAPEVDIPAYSADLDAAMLVVRKMNEPHDGKFDRYARFIAELEKIVGSDMFFDLFYCDPASDDQHLTAERLCVAALRAVGVEVQL